MKKKAVSDSPTEPNSQVVLVTGAARGIGRAVTTRFLERGSRVVGIDLLPEVTTQSNQAHYRGIAADITLRSDLERVFSEVKNAFGRLDVLVLNAGIVPRSQRIAEVTDAVWNRVIEVNLTANLALLRLGYPLLQACPAGGQVIVVGSKTVKAPGRGQAAYSASKAALVQIARIAALEWGADRIRVNVVNPDAVFDTGVFTAELLAERAAHYGISVEEYKNRNVLGTAITSANVAELIVELSGPAFACSTGLQISVDGGNDRVI